MLPVSMMVWISMNFWQMIVRPSALFFVPLKKGCHRHPCSNRSRQGSRRRLRGTGSEECLHSCIPPAPVGPSADGTARESDCADVRAIGDSRKHVFATTPFQQVCLRLRIGMLRMNGNRHDRGDELCATVLMFD